MNVERCPDFDPRPADIVICMKDLMSHNSHDRAKLVAKKHNLPFIALSRKAADWKERLARYVSPPTPAPVSGSGLLRPSVKVVTGLADIAESTQMFAPEPEPLDDCPEELSIDQHKELLAMFESENSVLMEETRHLQKKLAESDELAGKLERQLEASGQKLLSERRQWQEEMSQARRDLATAQNKKAQLDTPTLLAWLGLIQKAKSGDNAAMLQLLELAATADVDTKTLLSLVR